MRNRLILLAAIGVGSLVAAMAAFAGNPNFLRYKDATIVYGGTSASTLKVSATAAGAGADTSFSDPRVLVDGIVIVGVKEGVSTTLTASYKAVYVCVNGGGNAPSAANKLTLVGEFETSAVFPAAKNGRAEGFLLTDPLPSAADAAAAEGFACPSGQTLEFDQVIFSGLVLAIEGGEVVPLTTTLVSQSVHGLG